MKKILRSLRWLVLGFCVLIVIALIFIHNLNFSLSEQEINTAFSGLPYESEHHFLTHLDRQIHYVAIGDTSNPKVLFIHGSPGSWDNFIDFMSNPELLSKFRMISVDRPGFGRSGNGIPERSLPHQAEVISMILDQENRSTKSILAGHSFGGPVIARVAIDYPEKVDGLIFIAASIDPDLEKTKWFQIPFHYKVLSWILPNMLYSTNEEIIALKQELNNMKPLWKLIDQPSSIIQGKKDNLVPYENALFAQKMLTNAPTNLVIKDMNHFVLWENPELIVQELVKIDSLIIN